MLQWRPAVMQPGTLSCSLAVRGDCSACSHSKRLTRSSRSPATRTLYTSLEARHVLPVSSAFLQ
jgi:hypothetical protein